MDMFVWLLFSSLALMAATIDLSVLSYNCDGFSKQKSDFLCDLIDDIDPDIICVQETWLLDSNPGSLGDVSEQFMYHAVAGVDHCQNVLPGRVPGGVAILFDKKLSKHIRPVFSGSRRICAVKYANLNVNILICSVYMPCDKQVSCVQDEYIETLNSIETLIQSENFTGVLLAGDWNTDFMRNNAQSRELECFLGRNDICCSEHSGSYTYQTKNLGVRSNIDHILISHCLDPSMNVKTNHVDSGCNLSPHSPLHLVVNIPVSEDVGINGGAARDDNKYVKPQSSVRPAWHKVTDNDIENYHDMLNQNLHDIYLPTSCIECNDYFCVNDTHRSDITRYCNELIMSCLSAGWSVFPMCFPRKPLKPYFNNIIAPHKEQSLLWHAIWVNAGRPREGIVAQIMRQTRAKYHYFIRWAHNNQSHLKRGRMAEAIANNDSRNFWQEC